MQCGDRSRYVQSHARSCLRRLLLCEIKRKKQKRSQTKPTQTRHDRHDKTREPRRLFRRSRFSGNRSFDRCMVHLQISACGQPSLTSHSEQDAAKSMADIAMRCLDCDTSNIVRRYKLCLGKINILASLLSELASSAPTERNCLTEQVGRIFFRAKI